METIELHYKRFRLNDDEFYEFCQENDALTLERDANGTILIMSNTGGKTGARNAKLIARLINWSEQTGLGEIFDSSTAFRLPSTAVRSADASFVSHDRWQALTDEEQEKFPPLCPDFVVELLSSSDRLPDLKKKVQDDWMAAGCRLAWLIDPKAETVHIFRADGSIQILRSFEQPLSGEDVLPGFTLDLGAIR
ncbi:Uma2 family endonuclease [Tellurirhabdus rosea]|uniref:Uma2 family endonuclease n=1 Tax=Tellurirhabdus rosea TaxID=2674997 RepID=UPI002259B0B7|nr:Uma2 family endonuclease [Tellurirhabdus rosea]